MVSGRPSSRGEYNITNDPSRFQTNSWRASVKNTNPQVIVFDNVSTSGSDITSDLVTSTNSVQAIFVQKNGTGNVEIHASVNGNIWSKIATLDNTTTVWEKEDPPYPLLKFVLKTAASNVSVHMFRKYAAF